MRGQTVLADTRDGGGVRLVLQATLHHVPPQQTLWERRRGEGGERVRGRGERERRERVRWRGEREREGRNEEGGERVNHS